MLTERRKEMFKRFNLEHSIMKEGIATSYFKSKQMDSLANGMKYFDFEQITAQEFCNIFSILDTIFADFIEKRTEM